MPADPTGSPRHGIGAWLVFVLAILVVLAVMAGCAVLVYGPLFGLW